jgi:16S rRNA (guanine1207-N2)-methyltransferase
MNNKNYQPYEQTKCFSVKLNGEMIEVISKPGLYDWDQLLPSTELLAEYQNLLPSDYVRIFGCHHGALSVFTARNLPDGKLSISDNNFIALEMTRKTLTVNNISTADLITRVDLSPDENQLYNVACIQMPKGRTLARRWLFQAYWSLKNNGRLYISGSNKSGVQSLIKDARDLFKKTQILDYKKGNRVSLHIKQSEYFSLPDWTSAPGIAFGSWVEFTVSSLDQNYKIMSLPGVFSFDHLDAGTKMLLDVIKIKPGSAVLDVGCGYGMIGLYAASHGAGWVDFIDSDLLAVASCKKTLLNNRITNSTVYTGDLLDSIASKKYDLILSNPPFHIGQAVNFQIAEAMIKQSYQVLNPEGSLTIVANRFIPYDRLIDEIFGNVSYLAETGRYYVLSGIKPR